MKQRLLLIAVAISSAFHGYSASGGPDAFGYTYIDSHELGGPTFNWIDISTTGTLVTDATNADDSHDFNNTLSFPFPFYGNTYTDIAIGSNGPVYFEDNYLGFSNVCLPGTPAYTMTEFTFIAPLWDDLNPSAGGDIYFQDFGTYAVIQFDDVFPYGAASGDTWQVILYDDGKILMQFLETSDYAPATDFTVGIQGDPATGLEYLCDGTGNPISDNLAILWSPCDTYSSMIEAQCDSYTSPSGNYTWTTSGIYKDTIPNAAMCDSIITIDLSINSTANTLTEVQCDPYTSPSGNYTWTTTGTYMDTIPNAAGCDSVLTIDLTINSTTNTLTEVQCDPYTSPSGNYTWTTTGTYMDTIPNAAGCDSVLTIDLTINAVDNTVSASGVTISANEAGASYTWVDCDNGYQAISGETGQSFTATANGNYAVVVDNGNCSDTSACTAITSVGLDELDFFELSMHPNPASDYLTLKSAKELKGARVSIVEFSGRVVLTLTDLENKEAQINVSELSSGSYTLILESDAIKGRKMFIKQ